MKKVEAIIRHHKLEAVRDALLQAGVEGMTVTEVVGRGHKRGSTFTYRGATGEQAFVPNMKVETVVADDQTESVVDAIFQSAHSGEVGDGRIIVTPIESVTRIRTGEVDESDSEFVRHRARTPAFAAAPDRFSFDRFR